MRTKSARWIAVSLSAVLLPACVLMPVRLVPETEPSQPAAPSVARIAPPPPPPQVGQVMVAQGPNGQPIYLQAVPMPSEALPVQYVTAARPQPSVPEESEVVAVTHTAEPPLAPPILPEPVRSAAKPLPPAKPEPAPAPLPKVVAKPAIPDRPFVAPPGAQYIVLQPSEPVRQAGHASEVMPNLLSPPMPAEELKLVSAPKPTPTPASTPLVDAVRSYQDHATADADRQLSHLDPINRDLLKKLLPLAVRLGDSSNQKADPAEIAEVVDQMQQMLVALRSKAALRLEKLCYCRAPAKPVRMGVYQPLPDDHAYRQGETVELYMELKNF